MVGKVMELDHDDRASGSGNHRFMGDNQDSDGGGGGVEHTDGDDDLSDLSALSDVESTLSSLSVDGTLALGDSGNTVVVDHSIFQESDEEEEEVEVEESEKKNEPNNGVADAVVGNLFNDDETSIDLHKEVFDMFQEERRRNDAYQSSSSVEFQLQIHDFQKVIENDICQQNLESSHNNSKVFPPLNTTVFEQSGNDWLKGKYVNEKDWDGAVPKNPRRSKQLPSSSSSRRTKRKSMTRPNLNMDSTAEIAPLVGLEQQEATILAEEERDEKSEYCVAQAIDDENETKRRRRKKKTKRKKSKGNHISIGDAVLDVSEGRKKERRKKDKKKKKSKWRESPTGEEEKVEEEAPVDEVFQEMLALNTSRIAAISANEEITMTVQPKTDTNTNAIDKELDNRIKSAQSSSRTSPAAVGRVPTPKRSDQHQPTKDRTKALPSAKTDTKPSPNSVIIPTDPSWAGTEGLVGSRLSRQPSTELSAASSTQTPASFAAVRARSRSTPRYRLETMSQPLKENRSWSTPKSRIQAMLPKLMGVRERLRRKKDETSTNSEVSSRKRRGSLPKTTMN